MASGPAADAFGAEAERLSEVVLALDEAAFSRPTPCPPWSVAELLYHVRIGSGRISGMLAEPEPEAGPVTSAAAYFRPGQRFSPEVNQDRIEVARRGAAALGSGSAVARDYDLAWRETRARVRHAPQGRLVQTRHGDRMLLAEFLRTRVLELAVHGLDLAAGLGRPTWMTESAAAVVTELILPGAATARLLDEAGWDHPTLIAKATGRLPLSQPEAALLGRHGLRRLSLA